MMTTTTAPYDELLADMLAGDPIVRTAALIDAQRRHYSGMLVVDLACDKAGIVMTVTQLCQHLRGSDAPAQIRRRGGKCLHDTSNVTWYDEDEHSNAHGPGLRGGAGR